MTGNTESNISMDIETVRADVKRLRIMIEDEILRLRQIMREYILAEDAYANAWSAEDDEFQTVKERWRKAWEALNIEAERID